MVRGAGTALLVPIRVRSETAFAERGRRAGHAPRDVPERPPFKGPGQSNAVLAPPRDDVRTARFIGLAANPCEGADFAQAHSCRHYEFHDNLKPVGRVFRDASNLADSRPLRPSVVLG